MTGFYVRLFTRAARLPLSAVAAIVLLAGNAGAQGPAPPPGAGAAAPDPVVARVDGEPIHMSDVAAAAQSLPPNTRNIPQQTLYPMILDQLIDGKALVIEARKDGLDKDLAVQREIAAATEHVLQTAMLNKVVGPSITDEALHTLYDKDIAGKGGEDEVHARHILVDNEELANKIIAELKNGADFAALAKKYSKDPSADQNGDLGYFRKDEMVPEFAKVAFALKVGQISDTPVHTQFGWHVIQVLDRRHAPPPTFDQARDELRQKAIQQGIQQAVVNARSKVKVEKFNPDGSPQRPTDTAEPPAPVKP
jgi:peptidyl-prolyl cis-trans isomerase C